MPQGLPYSAIGSYQKELYYMLAFSKQYPNSSYLRRMLQLYNLRIQKEKPKSISRPEILIAICAEIGYLNPKYSQNVIAIISYLVTTIDDLEKRKAIIVSVREKLERLPNIGMIQVWLQRMTYQADIEDIWCPYEELLCKLAMDGDVPRISAVEMVDQNPIGRSSRSNPATYMKVFDEVRALYAKQPLSKTRGYKAGFFSFNVEGGRCENCQGEGQVTVSMQFMSDVHLICDECHGSRYKDEALEVLYKGKNISQILEMTVDQALEFFDDDDTQSIYTRLKPLQDVGLGYLMLGQSSSSLSGGECQRIKLASYLVKGEAEQPMLFIFDEPSTGLHFHDIQKLLAAFDRLIERGHSIVVIEHHHDIIKVADWVIDMGPEGGDEGGRVVFAGTPENLLDCKESYTAKYLKLK